MVESVCAQSTTSSDFVAHHQRFVRIVALPLLTSHAITKK